MRESQRSMFELYGPSFVSAAVEIGRLRHIMRGIENSDEKHVTLNDELVWAVLHAFRAFHEAAGTVGARMACIATERMIAALEETPCKITLLVFANGLADIESRFADQLTLVKLFVVPEDAPFCLVVLISF